MIELLLNLLGSFLDICLGGEKGREWKLSDFPRVLYSRVLGTSMDFFGGPTDRVGDSFNLFVCPCQNCTSLMRICA